MYCLYGHEYIFEEVRFLKKFPCLSCCLPLYDMFREIATLQSCAEILETGWKNCDLEEQGFEVHDAFS